ncbi:MAG: hypothetical protein ACYS22_10350, partial [Planctomycetota bacterium]
MKKFAIGCGLLLVLVAGGLATILYTGKKKFEPKVTLILQQVSSNQVQALYDEAAPEFRASVSLPQLRGLAESLNATLGPFKETGQISGSSFDKKSDVSQGSLSLALVFERGETKGTFKFLKRDGDWHLLGLDVDIPEALRLKEDPAALDPLAREFLQRYSAGEEAAIYENFASELKEALPASDFDTQIDSTRARLGKVVEAQLASTDKDEEGYYHLKYEVRYERGPGIAT